MFCGLVVECKSPKKTSVALSGKLPTPTKTQRFKPNGVGEEPSEFRISRSPLTFNRLSTISVYGLSVGEQRPVLLSFQ